MSLRHFKEREFRNFAAMNTEFVNWLDEVRHRAGVPFHINSSYRAGDPGLHGAGCAVDLDSTRWSSADKWKVAHAVLTTPTPWPAAVEFEPVFSPVDKHWHVGLDFRAGAVNEFIEADD